MQPEEALRGGASGPRGAVWQGVVVDDHAIIARCRRDSVTDDHASGSAEASGVAGDPVAAVRRGGLRRLGAQGLREALSLQHALTSLGVFGLHSDAAQLALPAALL